MESDVGVGGKAKFSIHSNPLYPRIPIHTEHEVKDVVSR